MKMFPLTSICSEFGRCMKVWENYLENVYTLILESFFYSFVVGFGLSVVCAWFWVFCTDCLSSVLCDLSSQMALLAKRFLCKEVQHGYRCKKQENGISYFLNFCIQGTFLYCLHVAFWYYVPFLLSRTVTDALGFERLRGNTNNSGKFVLYYKG